MNVRFELFILSVDEVVIYYFALPELDLNISPKTVNSPHLHFQHSDAYILL